MMAVLEMKRTYQSPRDGVSWELVNHGGKMTRSSLCRDVGIKQADLDIILADLEREGRIKRTVGKHGELISLKDRFS
jgi:DNA-binding MarR family transcriptional regulator